jgi:hypothetical protein
VAVILNATAVPSKTLALLGSLESEHASSGMQVRTSVYGGSNHSSTGAKLSTVLNIYTQQSGVTSTSTY